MKCINVRFGSKVDARSFYFWKIFLRQNRKGFFTNRVKVGLCSTSNMEDGGMTNTRCTPPSFLISNL